MGRNDLKSRQPLRNSPRQHNRAGDKPQGENRSEKNKNCGGETDVVKPAVRYDGLVARFGSEVPAAAKVAIASLYGLGSSLENPMLV
jgi:hypothetical protein